MGITPSFTGKFIPPPMVPPIMDILLSSPRFHPDMHVGELVLLSDRLADRGHDIRGIQEAGRHSTDRFPIDDIPVPEMGSPWWIRLWSYYRSWRQGVDSYLESHSPDVIVTNQRTHVPTMQGATGHGVPVVGYIEGLGFMRYNPKKLELDKEPKFFNLPLESKLQYPFVRSLYHQQRVAFSEFESVIVLSEFLGSTIKVTFDVDTTLLRTTVDLDAFRAEGRNPEYITMINPRTELKGAGIFLNIVRRMPDQRFLVAGEFDSEKSQRRAAELDNLEHRGWVEDMREVYAETKLLLVPSLVEEGGPRVIVEAFANGIPVIGTDRGGTGEFIDDAGAVVDDPHDISLWERHIESVIDRYAELSAVAAERAELFDANRNADRFERVVKRAVYHNV